MAAGGTVSDPAVAQLADGRWAVAWTGSNDGSNAGVYAQLFDAAGIAQGGAFLASDQIYDTQYQPEIAALADGGFAIAYYEDDSVTNRDGVYIYRDAVVQLFGADGGRIDGAQKLNLQSTSVTQSQPALAARPLSEGGGFVAAWTASQSATEGDGSGYAVLQAVFGAPEGFVIDSRPEVAGFAGTSLEEAAVNAGLTAIDADGLVGAAASEGADFAGGQLVFALDLANLDLNREPLSQHSLGVIDQGGGPGQIGVSGSTVSYGGSVIGTLSGGQQSVTVSFTAAAGAEAVEALFKALGYANPSDAVFPDIPYTVSLTDSLGRSWQDRGSFAVTPQADSDGPVPGETQVNAAAADDQYDPAMARLADGGWVVVFADDATGGNSEDIRAAIYNADGSLRAADILVNDAAAGRQHEPAVTAWGDGFAVAWRSDQTTAGDGSLSHVMMAGFDAAGAKTVADFQLNGYTANYQWSPALATLADGNVAAAWTSRGQDGSVDGVYGKILALSASGTPVTEVMAETRLSGTSSGYQNYPSLSATADGGFVLGYQSQNIDGSGYAAMARGFGAAGAEAFGEIRLNTTGSNDQSGVQVAALAGPGGTHGGFVAVWQSQGGDDGSGWSIVARRYDPAGNPLDAPFVVNGNTEGTQQQPAVAALADGGFVIGWHDADYQGSYAQYRTVDLQRYGADGLRIDGEETVSLPTGTSADTAQRPALLALDGDDFVVAWDSNYAGAEEGPDVSGYAVHQRIFGDPADYAVSVTSLPTPQVSEFAGQHFTTAAAKAAPQLIDAAIAFDPDGVADFDGWVLSAALPASLAGETLSVASSGTGAGQISVSGSSILYGGTVIGQLAAVPGEAGYRPFVVRHFNVGQSISALADVDFGAAPDHVEAVAAVSYSGTFYPGGPGDYFAAAADGSVWIDTAGDYTFYLRSDDGSQLTVDGVKIIDNDGVHGSTEVSATVSLSAGYHDISATYFENTSSSVLSLEWAGPDSGGARVSTSAPPAASPAGGIEVTLNGNADAAAIEALIEALAYRLDPAAAGGFRSGRHLRRPRALTPCRGRRGPENGPPQRRHRPRAREALTLAAGLRRPSPPPPDGTWTSAVQGSRDLRLTGWNATAEVRRSGSADAWRRSPPAWP